jgi:hypothetical protein
MAKFTAIVQKRVTFRRPALNTSAKPLLVDTQGTELPKDETGAYVGAGIQKIDVTTTDTTDDPLCDEAGNPIEAGTVEAMLRRIKEHFADEGETEVLHVTVQETKSVGEYTGKEVMEP